MTKVLNSEKHIQQMVRTWLKSLTCGLRVRRADLQTTLFPFYPLRPNINMRLLNTVLHTFRMVLLERICSNITKFYLWWAFHQFSLPFCLIRQRYCWEKLDVDWKLKDWNPVIFLWVADPCKNVSCDYYAKCYALPNDTADCRCVEDCTNEPVKPVCGSDMVSYPNQCTLKANACVEKTATTVKSSGICRKCSQRVSL